MQRPECPERATHNIRQLDMLAVAVKRQSCHFILPPLATNASVLGFSKVGQDRISP